MPEHAQSQPLGQFKATEVLQDLTYATRLLRRSPIVVLVGITGLALDRIRHQPVPPGDWRSHRARRKRPRRHAPTALFGLAYLDASAHKQAPEEFTAFAINTNSRPETQPQPNRPTTARLEIRIDRWSTDEEQDKLLAILKDNESNINTMNQELLRTLQHMPSVGTIRESHTLAWDLRFARQGPLDEGGRRIMLATDRPMPFWEVRDRPRSFDYPFTVIEMHLDKENRGEGKLLADTRLFIQPGTNALVLEHYDIQPVRLTEISARR